MVQREETVKVRESLAEEAASKTAALSRSLHAQSVAQMQFRAPQV